MKKKFLQDMESKVDSSDSSNVGGSNSISINENGNISPIDKDSSHSDNRNASGIGSFPVKETSTRRHQEDGNDDGEYR